MRDHEPLEIEELNGYWNRGDIDTCPPDLQTEFINWRFLESGFTTRYGVSPADTQNVNVLKIYPYFDAPAGDGFLELRSDNKIYHIVGTIGAWTTFQVSNAITGMTDFGFFSVNGRAYISPTVSTNLSGLTDEFVYVYAGNQTTMMRKAGGTPPTLAEGNMAAANSATAGNVEAGIHVFGVVYETNSGFLTQIGAVTPTVNADGTHKVDLSAIPIFGGGGGTLITKRHIVASKLIDPALYNGDPLSYELFFVPGGTIADNTTTTLTVNFFDSELITTAANLLDLLSEIPAGGGIGSYHNRMLVWDYEQTATTGQNIATVLVSNAGEPEAFNTVNGILQIPREGTGITFCQEYRDVLYVMKFNKIVAFNDNGDVPTSWPNAVVDQGLGSGKRGISVVGIYGGTNVESFITLNDQGVYLFTGNLTTPELSYKIKDYWSTITPVNINTGKVRAYTDSLHQILYIVIPEKNTILIGDWSNGLTAEKIKWSKWTFDNTPVDIMLFDKDNKLLFGTSTGVHYINSAVTSDIYNGASAVKIPNPTFISAMLPNEPDDNLIHFGGVRYRISGSGNLLSTYLGMDSVLTNTLAAIALSNTPGREPFLLANLVSQRARLQFTTTVINEVAKVNRVILYTKDIYTGYPQ